MSDAIATAIDGRSIEPGTVVYDGDGRRLGVVSEHTDDGFAVAVSEPADGDGSGVSHPGQTFGQGYLMWRCDECGDMGSLETGLPGECPNCAAPGTALYRSQED
ncbi:MAG: hypothetical protein ABEJ31_06255 [Haloarculaceae archaeon]